MPASRHSADVSGIYVNVPNSNPSTSRPGYGYIRWGWVGYVAFILLIFAATRQLRNLHYTVRDPPWRAR